MNRTNIIASVFPPLFWIPFFFGETTTSPPPPKRLLGEIGGFGARKTHSNDPVAQGPVLAAIAIPLPLLLEGRCVRGTLGAKAGED